MKTPFRTALTSVLLVLSGAAAAAMVLPQAGSAAPAPQVWRYRYVPSFSDVNLNDQLRGCVDVAITTIGAGPRERVVALCRY
jgi:hypothetical protein